jgi:hypothetical protein
VSEQFACSYLRGAVELTDERERHIAERHPDLLPRYRAQLATTVTDPDAVYRSPRSTTQHLFVHWYDAILSGKYVVVAVATDGRRRPRHWIVTAYLSRRPPTGAVEWTRPSA